MKKIVILVTLIILGIIGTSRLHSSWYDDVSQFVESSNPWFFRSGHINNGALAGHYCVDKYTGGIHTYLGFRITLSVK